MGRCPTLAFVIWGWGNDSSESGLQHKLRSWALLSSWSTVNMWTGCWV
jgi:hypothetical protein